MKIFKTILLIFLIILSALGIYFIVSKYQFLTKSKTEESKEILLEKIQTVMKLVSVEGNFSEIYNYKDYNLADSWPFRKSALIKVNARVLVGYDLENMIIDFDEETMTARIKNIPKAEIISIEHNLEYYDMKQGIFNVITTEDITEMSDRAKEFIRLEALNSELFQRAEKQKQESLDMLNFLFDNSGWRVLIEDDPLLN